MIFNFVIFFCFWFFYGHFYILIWQMSFFINVTLQIITQETLKIVWFLWNQCLLSSSLNPANGWMYSIPPICQWYAAGQRFSLGTPVSFSNCLDIKELLFKVALDTNNSKSLGSRAAKIIDLRPQALQHWHGFGSRYPCFYKWYRR